MPTRSERRPAGTGALFVRVDSAGRETWYGKWRVAGVQVKRTLGLRRVPGSSVGLTAREAEAALRRVMEATTTRPPTQERLDFAEAATRYIAHAERVLRRKPTTIADYTSMARRHLGPFFGGSSIQSIRAAHVTAYIQTKLQEGLAPKTVSNQLNFAHAVFGYAAKQGWASSNPIAATDRPRGESQNGDVRFLTAEEVDRLLGAVPKDLLGPTDNALYMTAAYTGLRQGELAALRWRDVDWAAGVIRVRRNFTRGQFGTPKTRRSVRAVPMAKRVAAELKRHHGSARYAGDDDLVFGASEYGSAIRRIPDEEAIPCSFGKRWHPSRPLSRSATQLWHTDGRGRSAAESYTRVDGALRLRDDTDIRGLCTGPIPGDSVGGACFWGLAGSALRLRKNRGRS